MKSYEVTFEATGFANNHEAIDEELTPSFCGGYNDQADKEGLFPSNVVGVVSGRITGDDAQGNSSIKVFVSVTLLIQAENKEKAELFKPPVDLLTKLSDAMSTDVDLDGGWEVSNVDETGMNTEEGRDYQYKLMVAGKPFLTGDESSASVIFGNLTGRNYAGKPRQEYMDYMAWMEHDNDSRLSGEIHLLNPEGAVLESGVIGEAVNLAASSGMLP